MCKSRNLFPKEEIIFWDFEKIGCKIAKQDDFSVSETSAGKQILSCYKWIVQIHSLILFQLLWRRVWFSGLYVFKFSVFVLVSFLIMIFTFLVIQVYLRLSGLRSPFQSSPQCLFASLCPSLSSFVKLCILVCVSVLPVLFW